MRVVCKHGYFCFYPETPLQIARFKDSYDIELFRVNDYYTFEELLDAPTYSIDGADYMGILARKTFSGLPWEVFKESGLVFNLATRSIAYKESVLTVVNFPAVGYYFSANTILVQPGSLNAQGERLVSYDSFLTNRMYQLEVLGVQYD